jgi:hypothetical protein
MSHPNEIRRDAQGLLEAVERRRQPAAPKTPTAKADRAS